MNDFIAALEETLNHLQGSTESLLIAMPMPRIMAILEENISSLKLDGSYQKATLAALFAPTGALQEIAIHNGWPTTFSQICSVVNTYTDSSRN